VYATIRRLRCQPGQAQAVADLINAEYLAQLREIPGAVSYALASVGDDVISSFGLFTDEASANEANARALSWTKERLGPLVASPLEALEGEVLVNATLR
jgi:hypothetical protein